MTGPTLRLELHQETPQGSPCNDKCAYEALGFMDWAFDHLERHPEEAAYVAERLIERVKQWRKESV